MMFTVKTEFTFISKFTPLHRLSENYLLTNSFQFKLKIISGIEKKLFLFLKTDILQ